MKIVHVVREIGAISTLIRDSESEWMKLVNPLPTDMNVKLTNQTSTSRNLVYEIRHAMDGMGKGKTVTGGTALHGQGKSNLCGIFGINTGLRHAMAQLTGNKKGKEVEGLVEGGLTALEVLNDNGWGKVCSFPSMLASLLGNVIPRSLEGLDGDPFLQSVIKKQTTDLEKIVSKLTKKSLFETEGWKRVPGCFYFMESFRLNPDHFELVAEKVIHQNSRGLDKFLDQVFNDLDCKPSSQLTDQKETFPTGNPRNYIVSTIKTFKLRFKTILRMF